MEYVILIITIIVFILAVAIKGNIDNRIEHKKFIKKIGNSFGTFSDFEITEQKMEKIKKYFSEHKEEKWVLDDITWNDSDMDDVFRQMNTCFSSAGEEYLYYMLRTPQMDEKVLNETERVVSFFADNKSVRIRFQDLYHQLGTTGKYSLYDYLNYLSNLGKRTNTMNVIALLVIVVSIAIIPFHVMTGVLLLVAILLFNIITYYRDKNVVKPYLTSFAYILRLITMSNKVLAYAPDEFKVYKDKIAEDCKKLKRFSRNSFITMTMGEVSSNPLDIIFDYLRMSLHIDLIKFNQMLNEIQGKKEIVDSLITTMGFLESTIVIANYRKALGTYAIPTFGEEIGFEEMYHPLIEDAIPNDLQMKKCILLTGSNASGKSTFLKMVSLNCILAQTIHTCTAKSAKLRLQYIYSSMKLEDSIEKKESYYMAEIRGIKRILDVAEKEKKVICFVDEVLRGTNTVERIAASTQILKSLSKGKVICIAATHDVELTSLLKKEYENYHFTEKIQKQDIYFSYKIKKGPAMTRNAILLLEKMGYPVELVEEAKKSAIYFMDNGTWEDNQWM